MPVRKKKKPVYGGPFRDVVLKSKDNHSYSNKSCGKIDLGVVVAATSGPYSPSVSRTLGEEDSVSDLGDSFEEAMEVTNHAFDESSKSSADSKTVANDDKPVDQAAKVHCVNLFRDNKYQSQGLKLGISESETEYVALEAHDSDDVLSAWGFCLIGYFAAKFPGKQALLKLCESWGVKYQHIVHESGWVIFKFECEDDRERVLKNGPYFVFDRPFLLKLMPNYFEVDNEEFKFMPVWIKLPCLPLEFWNVSALSKITTKVGTPLCTDKLTHTKERISFAARVLVEVDASKELVRSVQIKLPNGKFREQAVIFEHEPKFCSFCKAIGHSTQGCNENTQEACNKAAQLIHKDTTATSSGKNAVTKNASVPLQKIKPTYKDTIATPLGKNAVSENPLQRIQTTMNNTTTELPVGVGSSLPVPVPVPVLQEETNDAPFKEVTHRKAAKLQTVTKRNSTW